MRKPSNSTSSTGLNSKAGNRHDWAKSASRGAGRKLSTRGWGILRNFIFPLYRSSMIILVDPGFPHPPTPSRKGRGSEKTSIYREGSVPGALNSFRFSGGGLDCARCYHLEKTIKSARAHSPSPCGRGLGGGGSISILQYVSPTPDLFPQVERERKNKRLSRGKRGKEGWTVRVAIALLWGNLEITIKSGALNSFRVHHLDSPSPCGRGLGGGGSISILQYVSPTPDLFPQVERERKNKHLSRGKRAGCSEFFSFFWRRAGLCALLSS
jgi:hypothetical protein